MNITWFSKINKTERRKGVRLFLTHIFVNNIKNVFLFFCKLFIAFYKNDIIAVEDRKMQT